jgi:ribosomal protein S18 acetylase RimI-like enzyme
MLKDVWMVLRVMRARGGHLSGTEPPGLGEALSMAVLPEFETYVPPGGRSRVSMRLFQVAVEKMQRQGVNRVQLMVQPSNLAANLFYSSLGCTMEKTEHAGYAVHRYIYEVPPAR